MSLQVEQKKNNNSNNKTTKKQTNKQKKTKNKNNKNNNKNSNAFLSFLCSNYQQKKKFGAVFVQKSLKP